MARLARMIGRDGGDADGRRWPGSRNFSPRRSCAKSWMRRPLALSRGLIAADAPIVGAGVGRGVIRQLAQRLDRPYIAFDD